MIESASHQQGQQGQRPGGGWAFFPVIFQEPSTTTAHSTGLCGNSGGDELVGLKSLSWTMVKVGLSPGASMDLDDESPRSWRRRWDDGQSLEDGCSNLLR